MDPKYLAQMGSAGISKGLEAFRSLFDSIFSHLDSWVPRKASQVIFALGALYGVRRFINRRASLASRSSWNWDKEIILITGGSGGIGSRMITKFAERQTTVVSIDIKPPQQALPANVHFYQADVTSPDELHETVERIQLEVGNPTVLINNAGLALGKDLLNCTTDEIKRMINVNLLAHFWLVREFLPSMIKNNHGHVVSVASVASFITIASNIDYSCAKAGLLSFHEGLAQELKHRYNAAKVLTSIVFPYWVRTPLIKNLTAHPTFHDPLLEPEEAADAIVDHVLKCEGGQLFLPGYGGLLAGIRGFPMWLQEHIRDSKAGVLRETTF